MFCQYLIKYLCILSLIFNCNVAQNQYELPIVFPASFVQRQKPFELLTSNEVTAGSVVELSRAAESFTLDYFQRLSRFEVFNDNNVIVSPLSIWSLLLLLAEGSSGRTYEQLASVLRLPADLTRIRMVYKYMQSAFAQNNSAIQLESNEVLFGDINRPIDFDFQQILETTYAADYYPVNFIHQLETVNTMNNYVNHKTRGKIGRIVEASDLSDAFMVLISAIFFQGRWKDPFKVEDTRVQPFYNEQDIKIADVPMMFRKGGCSHIHVPTLQADIIELSYGFDRKFSMVIILPIKKVPLITVIDNLRVVGLYGIIENLNQSEEDPDLEIHLPRFSISSSYKLNNILRDMGLLDLFDRRSANLSKISRHPIFVSQFLQKATIDVDEQGTVASAANSATLSFQSIPAEFFVNRPFAFMIIERTTKSILFCGHVKNPAKNP